MSQTIDFLRQRFPVASAKVERTIGEARQNIAEVVTTGGEVAGAAVADGRKLAGLAIEHGKTAIDFTIGLGKAVDADARPMIAEAGTMAADAADKSVVLGKDALETARQVGAKLAGHAGYQLCHFAHRLKQ